MSDCISTSGAPALSISVVVCTWKRPESIRQLLLNLNAQAARAGEILVVEGHPTERGDCIRVDCPLCALPSTSSRRHLYTRAGLEHQRNVGADLASLPVVCYLDDDVLLESDCLEQIAKVFDRDREGEVGGVSGYMTNNVVYRRIPWHWRLRRALGVVPSLVPGQYTRSGHSIPMGFAEPFSGCRPVDYLVGYCMAYRRHILQELRFETDMYLGEDLHYSLRVGHRYQLLYCGDARLQHLHDPAARVSQRRYAFMSILNHFRIHRECLRNRTLWDSILFWYGVSLDLAVLAVLWLAGRNRGVAWDQMVGRLRAIGSLLRRGPDAIALDEAQRAFPAQGVGPK